ncbi:MAG: hypothetical protein A3E87_04580 [Gammaproteobacteria bacterium RIFCSPHIGHO2_12_FULL_35_23]|nr:MAG: hypothetical protein A3E87_04580 [Gammaproteobacteria bacterium RIFCSPHIGHO2_12_FULL_35_23]
MLAQANVLAPDIDLANIMLYWDPGTSRFRVKLIDFSMCVHSSTGKIVLQGRDRRVDAYTFIKNRVDVSGHAHFFQDRNTDYFILAFCFAKLLWEYIDSFQRLELPVAYRFGVHTAYPVIKKRSDISVPIQYQALVNLIEQMGQDSLSAEAVIVRPSALEIINACKRIPAIEYKAIQAVYLSILPLSVTGSLPLGDMGEGKDAEERVRRDLVAVTEEKQTLFVVTGDDKEGVGTDDAEKESRSYPPIATLTGLTFTHEDRYITKQDTPDFRQFIPNIKILDADTSLTLTAGESSASSPFLSSGSARLA